MRDVGLLTETIKVLFGCMLLSLVFVAILFVTGYPMAALAFIGLAIVLEHLFIITGTAALTARFVRSTMEAGANVALQAQSVDGKWDAVQATSYTNFARSLLSIAQSNGRHTEDSRALPVLDMNGRGGGGWLPHIEE